MNDPELKTEPPGDVPSPPFAYCPGDEPHRGRTREILAQHPEIRELIGRNPWTAAVIAGIVALQLGLAAALANASWWAVLAVAYCIGAFANHCLFVAIHECSHGLVFRRRSWNYLAGIIADIPNAFPSSVSFRRYHLKHHGFLGVYDLDADIPNRWEGRLVGTSPLRKALWLLLFPIFQLTRPPRLREIRFGDPWVWINTGIVLAVDVVVILLFGWGAFVYLLASFFFSVGLHPVGARWIQEHYVVAPPQETYSYYGPINLVAMNVGYHNEHHDFPSIPWNRLPDLRRIAADHYDHLVHHPSLTGLLLRFVFDREIDLHTRVVRPRHRQPTAAVRG